MLLDDGGFRQACANICTNKLRNSTLSFDSVFSGIHKIAPQSFKQCFVFRLFFVFCFFILPGQAVASWCQAVETWTWEPAGALTPQCGTCRTYLSPGWWEDRKSGVNERPDAARLPCSIIALPYSCCEESINSVVWIKRVGGGGRTGSGGETGRQRIAKLRSRFRPVQIPSPRVPGSSDEAVRLPPPSPRTGCSLCSSLHTKPSCLFTNHTVIFWLLLCLLLSLHRHVCLSLEASTCSFASSRTQRCHWHFSPVAALMGLPVCGALIIKAWGTVAAW